MKKLFSLAVVIVLFVSLMSGCTAGNKPYSNYTEVCNTKEYYERPLSLPVGFQNFSIGNYMDIYASYNGSICKFTDAGELRITYEDTLGFSAPYFYDGYIYSVSNGCLYKIDSSKKGTITQIGERMDGTGANCIVVNDDFAFITMHHYDENNKFSLKLMRVDLGTGEATELDLGTEQRLYCSAGGVMYVYTKEVVDREEVYSLYEIPTDGEPIYICDLTDVGATARFVLENGWFYYADTSGNICAKSMATGEINICVSNAGIIDFGQYSEIGMTFSDGNIYYYNAATGNVESFYTPHLINDRITVNICQTSAGSYIDFEKLGKRADISANLSMKTEENVKLKIMAGDSDVDIYFISATLARTLMDKDIYIPIESDLIKSFNDGCFDYIENACASKNGDIALIPISSYVPSIVYPIEAQEEVGFKREDLFFYDSFMDIARNHNTDRLVFQTADVIYEGLHAQYEEYYCDFENNKFDYTTDLYKNFYGELLNPTITGDDPAISLLINPIKYVDERHPEANLTSLDDPNYYPDITLFSAGRYAYCDYADQCPKFFEQWRAVPVPKISEKVNGNYIEVTFAYINPYTENYEDAVAALEVIAQNLSDISTNESAYSFLYEDKSAYASRYHTDSEVFSDFYEIAANGFLSDYRLIYELRDDIRQFDEGRITVDEAVEMYQRQVEIWLNE